MAFFSKKKEEKAEDKKVVKTPVTNAKKEKVKKDKKKTVKKLPPKTRKVTDQDLSWVINKPRITEKGAVIIEKANAYTFNIHKDATKTNVKDAIFNIYKVNPVKVNITKIRRKKVERQKGNTRTVGFKGGGKKAYIFLRKGDSIEFV